MAITNVGYDGSVTESQWASMIPMVGNSQYGVSGPNDWKVTVATGLDRGVAIAAGVGWGHGVMTTSTAVETLQGTTVASGSRWDLVVARRNWSGTGGLTTFAIIAGSSLKAIPARNTTPGNLDDQPIALVQFTAGQTAATAIVDLRCWGRNGGMVARDTLALTYLGVLGGQVKVNGVLWSCVPDVASGAPVWSASASDGAISLLGIGPTLEGGIPPSTSACFVQAGSFVGSTDGGSYGRITFPTPFPSGLITVQLTNGDTSIDRTRGVTLTPGMAGVPWNTGTKADVVFTLMNSNGAMMPNTLARINWFAIGW